MAQGDVPQLMRDDRCKLFARDLALLELPIKPAGDENAPIRRGKPVYRIDFVDKHLDPVQIQCRRHFISQRFQVWIGQNGGSTVQFASRPPDRNRYMTRPYRIASRMGVNLIMV